MFLKPILEWLFEFFSSDKYIKKNDDRYTIIKKKAFAIIAILLLIIFYLISVDVRLASYKIKLEKVQQQYTECLNSIEKK